MSKITNVVTLSEYAERHGYDVKRLRRYARNGDWPNADCEPFKFGGKNGLWCIDANAPAVELPVKSARGNRRTDGRQRMIVFCNPTERDAITQIVGPDNVIDPRVASKIRRDARKLENDVNG